MSNNKKIIGIVMIVFVVLVSYKFISSSIQENKEKSVLEERYRLEQLREQPLEICLKKAEDESIYKQTLEYGMLVSANEKCSMHFNEKDEYNCTLDYIFNSRLTREEKEYRFNEMIRNINAGKVRHEEEKEECYKRYKN